MVNNKEFRIGNYVLVDGVRRRVCCVRGDNSGQAPCIGFEYNNECEYAVCDSERVQGLPVNDALLRELAFVYHDYFKLWQRERPGKSYMIELSTDYDALDFSHNYMVRNIQYLHQLQNLFFCIQGKELFFENEQGSAAMPGQHSRHSMQVVNH